MLQPIAKRLLIKPITEEKKSILLSLKEDKPNQFTIIAIGDEVTKVAINEIVYLDKYAGSEIKHENETYLVIDESSILAKICNKC